jgi:Arc/MetJ-type ribon-helix-helix transcriptional regulator
MARRQVLVQLTDELLAILDERAARTRRSRSDLIRSALERALAAEAGAAVDAMIVDGYRRLPPTEIDAWAVASARRSIAAEPW